MMHLLSRWRLARDRKALHRAFSDAFPGHIVRIRHHHTNAGWEVCVGWPRSMTVVIPYDDARRRKFSDLIHRNREHATAYLEGG